MKLLRTDIPEVVIIEPTLFEDDRGWFYESYSELKFHALLRAEHLPVPRPFLQENCSMSKKGVVRGLHYQLSPCAQGKLVSVTQGAVFDVAVDIRKGSPTFGQWVAAELTAANRKMMWIPEGFAHGFMALEENTVFQYRVTDTYSKAHERSLAWDDPQLAIAWPAMADMLISEKDQCAPTLGEAELSDYIVPGNSETFDLKVLSDDRGSLVSIEKYLNIPFSIRRIYYIFGTQQDVSRGFHAHRDLQQLIVCVSGSCRMTLDDGKTRVDHIMDRPNKALLVQNMVWREMHDFSPDCVLIVVASEVYDERDYIRDYEDFLRVIDNAHSA
nr:dTDP-4-dehydrorhamnose 3,5-epimerase [Pseudomonas sp.]